MIDSTTPRSDSSPFSVKSFQVQDSIIVFELLWEKNKEIPEDLKQSLLELVAFYNEREAVEDGDVARGVMPAQSPWITDGFVASQYSDGEFRDVFC